MGQEDQVATDVPMVEHPRMGKMCLQVVGVPFRQHVRQGQSRLYPKEREGEDACTDDRSSQKRSLNLQLREPLGE